VRSVIASSSPSPFPATSPGPCSARRRRRRGSAEAEGGDDRGHQHGPFHRSLPVADRRPCAGERPHDVGLPVAGGEPQRRGTNQALVGRRSLCCSSGWACPSRAGALALAPCASSASTRCRSPRNTAACNALLADRRRRLAARHAPGDTPQPRLAVCAARDQRAGTIAGAAFVRIRAGPPADTSRCRRLPTRAANKMGVKPPRSISVTPARVTDRRTDLASWTVRRLHSDARAHPRPRRSGASRCPVCSRETAPHERVWSCDGSFALTWAPRCSSA